MDNETRDVRAERSLTINNFLLSIIIALGSAVYYDVRSSMDEIAESNKALVDAIVELKIFSGKAVVKFENIDIELNRQDVRLTGLEKGK